MAEAWFRNPVHHASALIDASALRVVWHRGLLIKRRISPVNHARVHFPTPLPWRVLSVGSQGALEWTPASRNDHDAVACYPVWHYGEDLDRLEALAAGKEDPSPWGDPYFAPRPGQERRVVVVGWPVITSHVGRQFMTLLGEMQADHPEAIIHLFEARYFRTAFGYGLGAADLEPAIEARFGRVMLPNGRNPHYGTLKQSQWEWVHLLGFSLADLESAEGRTAYNIASSVWAAEHFQTNALYNNRTDLEPGAIDAIEAPERTARRSISRYRKATVGDKVACDYCSLFDGCKLARVGGVCTLPDSETLALTKYFKSRDSDRIIDGLGDLLAKQSERAEWALDGERSAGEVDPNVTRLLNSIFDGGVKLAKLINPSLVGPKVAVQINNQSVTAMNPASLMAALVRELEEQGVPREEITPEMVMKLVGRPEPDAIEVLSRAAEEGQDDESL